jgi:nucleoside-diphosphate-sugar epimerase
MKNYKKAVVVGGAGFIGSHIVEHLLEHGQYFVTALDDLSTGRKENIEKFLQQEYKKYFTFVQGSILDLELLKKTFEGADVVFHQAALASVPKSIEFPVETSMANIEGTLHVLVAARDAKVRRVVYASSSSVYGDSAVLPKVETMPFNPLSPYAVHKMVNEYYAKLFYKLYGLETVGLRYFNVFGPRQNPNSKYAAVIPLFIQKIKNNEAVTIHGDGSTTRDFTYVENVVQANIKAATADAKDVAGDVFNIACGEAISLNQLVEKINSKLNKKTKPIHTDKRAGDIDHSLADITKAKSKLGFLPEFDFDTGLRKTIESLL